MKDNHKYPISQANHSTLEVSNKEKVEKKSVTKNKNVKSKDKQKLTPPITQLDSSSISFNLSEEDIEKTTYEPYEALQEVENNLKAEEEHKSSLDDDLKQEQEEQPNIVIPEFSEEFISSKTKDKFKSKKLTFYRYYSSKGIPVGCVVRCDKDINGDKVKSFAQFSYDRIKQQWRSSWSGDGKPLYNLQEIVARPDVPVMIVEGEKTAEAAKLLFPECVVTTSCGGGQSPRSSNWNCLTDRDVIIAKDNDITGNRYARTLNDILTKEGAKSISGLSPQRLGRYIITDGKPTKRGDKTPDKYDLADSLADGWTAELINEWKNHKDFSPFFEKLEDVVALGEESKDGDELIYLKGKRYKLNSGNRILYHETEEKDESGNIIKTWKELCGYIKPTHCTEDANGDHGLLVEIVTRRNKTIECFFPREEFATEKDTIKLLLKKGLPIPHLRDGVCYLINYYLNNYEPEFKVIGVDKVGWHGNCYLLPFVDNDRNSYLVQDTEELNTSQREEYILRSNSENPRKLIRRGTIEGWQESIGKLANGNNLLMFSIATAIAAPLFSIFSEEGCCFHFSGSSSIGKTTALYVASSVWGMGKPSSFRTTDNAAESLCKNSNDGLLLMDELAESDPNSLEKITYLFGNGTGKGRAKQSGEAKSITTFKILGLSTGEIGLQAKLNEKGKNTTAGQSVRFIEIAADSGKGLGIFDTLHHFENGRDLSDYLRKECQNCGVVIDEWMQYVSSNFNDLQKAIIFASKTWLDKYLPQNSDPQVQRVGKKFALIAAIGETAIDAEILLFAQGGISEACKVLFDRWLEQRGNNGSHELQGVIERLKMLTQEGINSRFLNANGTDENKTIQKVAGYKKLHQTLIEDPETGKKDNQEVIEEFWIIPEVFKKEVLEGRNLNVFCKLLIDKGYLLPDKLGKSQQTKRAAKQKPRKFYIVPADKISD